MWRHPLEVQTGSGEVLAEVARRDLEAGIKKGRQELGWDQMELPELGQAATDKVAVPNERAGVGVAFDAVAFHQDYAVKGRFAEVVPTMLSERNVPRWSDRSECACRGCALQRSISCLIRHCCSLASRWKRAGGGTVLRVGQVARLRGFGRLCRSDAWVDRSVGQL